MLTEVDILILYKIGVWSGGKESKATGRARSGGGGKEE